MCTSTISIISNASECEGRLGSAASTGHCQAKSKGDARHDRRVHGGRIGYSHMVQTPSSCTRHLCFCILLLHNFKMRVACFELQGISPKHLHLIFLSVFATRPAYPPVTQSPQSRKVASRVKYHHSVESRSSKIPSGLPPVRVALHLAAKAKNQTKTMCMYPYKLGYDMRMPQRCLPKLPRSVRLVEASILLITPNLTLPTSPSFDFLKPNLCSLFHILHPCNPRY